MGRTPPVFYGIRCHFAAIFAAFQRRVTSLQPLSGRYFFHERLAFTPS
jgi:hypothetical protein